MTDGLKHVAFGVLCDKDYIEALEPMIRERLIVVERDICESEVGAERKRGARDAFRWILGLRESLKTELKK